MWPEKKPDSMTAVWDMERWETRPRGKGEEKQFLLFSVARFRSIIYINYLICTNIVWVACKRNMPASVP